MNYRGFFLIILLITGCNSKPAAPVVNGGQLPQTRTIASVYQVVRGVGDVPCYREADNRSLTVTVLHPGQQVERVSLQEGLLQQEQTYWLHVSPLLGHRPACYIDVINLMPVA